MIQCGNLRKERSQVRPLGLPPVSGDVFLETLWSSGAGSGLSRSGRLENCFRTGGEFLRRGSGSVDWEGIGPRDFQRPQKEGRSQQKVVSHPSFPFSHFVHVCILWKFPFAAGKAGGGRGCGVGRPLGGPPTLHPLLFTGQ